jgi:hypothetical protein
MYDDDDGDDSSYDYVSNTYEKEISFHSDKGQMNHNTTHGSSNDKISKDQNPNIRNNISGSSSMAFFQVIKLTVLHVVMEVYHF